MNKIYLILIFGLLIAGAVSADTQSSFIFKQGSPFNLEIAMANADLSACLDCTCIISLFYPDGSPIIRNSPGINIDGSCEYINSTSILGTGFGGEMIFTNGVDNGRSTFTFDVTATGQNFSTAKSITYILIFVISLLVFLWLLLVGIYAPSNNQSDEMTGYIIAVSNMKYVKIFCLALAYLVALFIFYFAWTMSYAYLDLGAVSSIFYDIFIALAIITLPAFILGTYFVIANWIRDTKISEMLSRGLKVKGGEI